MIRGKYNWKAAMAAAVLVTACALPQRIWAENGGGGELAVFGGGASLSDGGGTHPAVGVDIGGKVSDHIRLFGEFGYVPLGSSSFGGTFSGVQVSSRASARMYQFGGGIRYFFTSGSKTTPFIELTAGNARFSSSASGSAGGVNISSSFSDNSLYYGGGVGLRYAMNERLGLRPEVRYLKFNGGGGAITFGAAVFFQFGK